ncbi:MAG: SDR family NAD(P)-dependent oxidoreductase [Sphingobacteriales bacterium]|nr:SDR family NAD(P)-dependent oxidoreductase [Sphingobacteriales bacterium]
MRTAIVTGAAGNLGKAVVRKFLEEGFTVCGTGLLPSGWTGYEGTRLDLSDEAAAGNWVESVIKKQGSVETAVLTVGGFAMGDIAGTGTKEITDQVRLNVETAYNVARPLFLQMLKQGRGTIFFIGSQAGLDEKKSKGLVAYGLAKSLLFRLAALMNEEASGTGVGVFVLVPFIIDTAENRASMPGADFSAWQTPEFLAETVFSYAMAPGKKDPVILL